MSSDICEVSLGGVRWEGQALALAERADGTRRTHTVVMSQEEELGLLFGAFGSSQVREGLALRHTARHRKEKKETRKKPEFSQWE